MDQPKIAIGTAQFGLEYGVAGLPKVSSFEARKILALAALNQIKVIDTAHQYGNALDVLGKCRKLIADKGFKIVLKLPEIPSELTLWKIQDIRDVILSDLLRLKVDSVDTLMIHNPICMLKSGADLVYDLIVNMKYLGFATKIGVSFYDLLEAKTVLSRYHFDVVSFPSNIVDHRFVDSALDFLSALRVEMHARSIFLQGMLLLDHNEMIKTMTWDFARARRNISIKFENNMLKACLAYLRQQYPINYGVVGVHSVQQLQEIITTYNQINSWYNFESYKINDMRVTDPRRW